MLNSESKKVKLEAEIARCKFKNKRLLIVEGLQDIKRYKDIILKENNNIVVKQIASFQGQGKGCKSITKCLNEKKDYLDKNMCGKIVKAIIDSDAKEYRKECFLDLGDMKNIEKYLIVLDNYSIESYVYGENCILNNLSFFMDADKEQIKKVVLKEFFNKLNDKIIEDGYYIGILCLCKELKPDKYSGVFSYKCDISNIKNYYKRKQKLKDEIQNFKELILEIEKKFDLKKDLYTVRKILNGKHMLYIVSTELIKSLSDSFTEDICNTSLLEIACSLDGECSIDNKCIFKVNSTSMLKQQDAQVDNLYNQLIGNFDEEERIKLRDNIINKYI